MVKAGHIAVLDALLDGQTLPPGRNQIAHASASVKERFGQANVLFAVDQLIKRVLRSMTSLVSGVFRLIPVPGAQQILRVVQMFLPIAVGFIDAVILADSFRTRADNPWGAARDGLVLYGQNLKPMFKNAVWLTVIVYGLSFLIFLLLLAPAAAVAYLMPGGWSATGVWWPFCSPGVSRWQCSNPLQSLA